MKHTEGPWHIEGKWKRFIRDYPLYIQTTVIKGPDRQIIGCTIYDSQNSQEANAHLIAAAPDLLEACKVAISSLTRLEQTGHYAPWIIDSYNIINKAISRAEGGELK